VASTVAAYIDGLVVNCGMHRVVFSVDGAGRRVLGLFLVVVVIHGGLRGLSRSMEGRHKALDVRWHLAKQGMFSDKRPLIENEVDQIA
jgi:hypothetical protein